MRNGSAKIMQGKNDITSREDIHLIVTTFYKQLLENSSISHYFVDVIDNLDAHLNKITDFWEAQILQVKSKYKGNPMEAHINLDKRYKHDISQQNFAEWLKFWTKTIDQLFEGERANLAKSRARNMATHIFIEMYKNRNANPEEQ